MKSRFAFTTLGVTAAAILITGLLTGCQGTHEARSVKTVGFLQDYEQLKPGKDGGARLAYVNPKTDFAKYHSILLDPVKLYVAEGSFYINSSTEARQSLVNYLDASIRKELEGSFPFVEKPGPGVMRFRIAITDAQGSNVVTDTISSVVPIGVAVSILKSAITGAGTGVGSCSVEFEALDAVTGERLAAAVDKRIGDKFTGSFDKFSQWHAFQTAVDYWSALLKTRLLELQAGPAAPKKP